MSIVYKRLYPEWDFSYEEYEPGRNILYFDPCTERFEESLTDRFLSLDRALRFSDCIIIRGRTRKFWASLEQHRPELEKHAGTRPIVALVGSLRQPNTSDIAPRLIPVVGGDVCGSSDLHTFQKIELESILARNGAVFSPHDHHYSLPSGQHVRKFVRLACALQDPVEITRIADWILPLIEPRTLLIGDTGTILPLLYVLRHEAKVNLDANVSIRVLNRYPKGASAVARVIDESRAKLGLHGGTLLFVVSVNSSGQFLRFIEQQAPNDQLVKSAVVIVADTSEEKIKHTVLYREPVERFEAQEGECVLCKEGSPVFPIDGRTYERLPRPIWKPVYITKEEACRHTDFWMAVEQTDAIAFNRPYKGAEPGGHRHYSMYIDVARLLGSDWFRTLVEKKLSSMGSPDLVIIPRHETTAQLIALAKSVFGNKAIETIDGDVLSEKALATLRDLSSKHTVLILDDAYVEGRTLPNISNKVYSLNKAVRRQAFVLLARPSSTEQFQTVTRRFIYAGQETTKHFDCAYFILMPKHDACPWQTERDVLTKILSWTGLNDSERKVIQDRILQLEGQKSAPPLLWGNDDGSARIGGSFFGALRESTLFAAAAAESQACRDHMGLIKNGKIKGAKPTDPQGSSLEPYIDLKTTFRYYFDRCIIAAVLRTFTVEELSRFGIGNTLDEPIKALIAGNGPGMLEEILWATYLRKLPARSILSIAKAVTKRSDIANVLINLIENGPDHGSQPAKQSA